MKNFKQWYENNIACDIYNCHELRTWLYGNYKSYTKFEDSCLLTKDNRKDFRTLYGKPDATWTGEFRFSVWIREFKGEKFIVLTAKTKGTCIEIANTSPCIDINEKASVIIAFVKSVLVSLKRIGAKI